MDGSTQSITALHLSDRERRKTAASLMMTATIQDSVGNSEGALESLLLRAKYLDGLEDE